MEKKIIEISKSAKEFMDKHPLSEEEKQLQLALLYYPYIMNKTISIGEVSKFMNIGRLDLMSLYENAEVPMYYYDKADMNEINDLLELMKR